jgi:hypothetical protein
VIPLADALRLLLQAGYSKVLCFPTDRHPLLLMVENLGQIRVTDCKVPVRYLPPEAQPHQISKLFDVAA